MMRYAAVEAFLAQKAIEPRHRFKGRTRLSCFEENGAVIWRLPLHAFCHKPEAFIQPLDWLQFWGCFSYEMTVTVFDPLQDFARPRSRTGPGKGQYTFNVLRLPLLRRPGAFRLRHAFRGETGLRHEHKDLEGREGIADAELVIAGLGESFNGRTAGLQPANEGSTPSSSTKFAREAVAVKAPV